MAFVVKNVSFFSFYGSNALVINGDINLSVCTLLNTDKYAYLAGLKRMKMEPKEFKNIEEDRSKFYSYESDWEHTYFDERTGGYLVTEVSRKYKHMSKNELDIFRKEQKMGMKFASFGFQIEHLNEIAGISSPDVKLRRIGPDIIVNGKAAEFKRLSSSNKIYLEGKDAKYKKRASLVMFEFTKHAKGITEKIILLSQKGIHGHYYYSDEQRYHSF